MQSLEYVNQVFLDLLVILNHHNRIPVLPSLQSLRETMQKLRGLLVIHTEPEMAKNVDDETLLFLLDITFKENGDDSLLGI
jgi:hypothetical protein